MRYLLVQEIVGALKIYLKGEECSHFSDCRLLWRLKASQPPGSDRFLEYPWMVENLMLKRGRLLDIGSTSADLLDHFLPESVEISGIDLNARESSGKRIKLVKGDIRKTNYLDNYFDTVVCISTLEHIGVVGRYHSDDDPKGDQKALREIHRIMKKGATLLLTVPYGVKDVLPINRLYNKKKLKKVLKGFRAISEEYRKYNQQFGYWFNVSESDAAKTDMLTDRWYALALIRAVKV